jgi:Peptidase family M28
MRFNGKKIKTILYRAFRFLLLLTVFLFAIWICIAQPTSLTNTPSNIKVNAERLKEHVQVLSEQFYPRDYSHTDNLNLCAEYILDQFQKAGISSVTYQSFSVDEKEYKNVIGLAGNPGQKRIVIGAHYDACLDTPGADDNASGIAGLIELAHLLAKDSSLQHEIEFVAYTLEEPPFFGTDQMGSAVHAQSLVEDSIDVKVIIALDMIGYFDDQKGSQQYPVPLLKLFYPGKGNFITIVGSLDQRPITKKIKGLMKSTSDLPVYSINAPAIIPGIDYSDHRNYWKHGYNAVMVTDTAFCRNHAYHGLNDTSDRLDYERMAKVVIGLYEAIKGCN